LLKAHFQLTCKRLPARLLPRKGPTHVFYTFLYPFHQTLTMLNVLRYPSFRIVMAALTAGLITFVFYPIFIRKLKALSFGQEVRDDGPQTHLKKQGTPTMGGLLLLTAIIISCLLWGDLQHVGLWLLIYVSVGYGFIGFLDDWHKIKRSNTKGLSAKSKLFWQAAIGLSALLIYSGDFSSLPFSSAISIPFISIEKLLITPPTWLFLFFSLFIIVATSNGVNLTDGLDGLAIGPVINSAFVFLILAYVAGTTIGDFNIADYLKILRVDGASELSVFCGAVIGAGVGFLWYNTYPAHIFMGDVGSLALGGALGMLAILTKNELISALLHGVFFMETVSVMLQVGSFKLRKKRIFKMAPLHHHFELLGWAEPQIIVRFWIVSGLLAVLTLLSLKLR
jgi:phospho-N-acetylmuramoyl-pentapeptide-transferase